MQPMKNEFEMPGGESALSRISSFKAMENKGSSVQQSMRSMRIAHGGSPSLLWPLVAIPTSYSVCCCFSPPAAGAAYQGANFFAFSLKNLVRDARSLILSAEGQT